MKVTTIDELLSILREKNKKSLHNFLQFKRALENEFQRSVDLGFEHTLKPVVKENLQGKITYV